MHQLSLEQHAQTLTATGEQPTTTYSISRPVVGSPKHHHMLLAQQYENYVEEGKRLLPTCLADAQWELLPRTYNVKNCKTWKLYHPLFKVHHRPLLSQQLETAAFITLFYHLDTTAAHRKQLYQHYPEMKAFVLYPHLHQHQILSMPFSLKAGYPILWPTQKQVLERAAKINYGQPPEPKPEKLIAGIHYQG